MFSIQVFEGTQTEVVSFTEEGSGVVWFQAAHIGAILDFTNPYRYLPTVLKPHEYKEVKTGVGRPSLFIREEGCYKLVMKSKSVFAERFQEWLAYDVLPQIRKTGHFGNVPNQESEASEFWLLIDGAIARNLEPERTIDLHKRFNGQPAPVYATKRGRLAKQTDPDQAPSLEIKLQMFVRTMTTLKRDWVTAREVHQYNTKIGGSKGSKQAAIELVAAGKLKQFKQGRATAYSLP